MGDLEQWQQWMENFIFEYVPDFLLAIVVLVIGLWVIKRFIKFVSKMFLKGGLPSDIVPSLVSFLDIIAKVALIFVVAGMVGIETTSFVAIFAAAGFAVGMALQGSLGNFAAGVLILLFKPYRISDWIEVDDRFGQVEEIQIFNTIVVTPGRKTVIIPNGQVIENIVTNYSTKGFIRLELSVTMPYAESFPRVKKIILETLKDIPYILQDPPPQVGIETYDSHNIVITIRPFVNPNDYWDVTFSIHEQIKNAFHQHGIKVAYSEGIELGDIGE